MLMAVSATVLVAALGFRHLRGALLPLVILTELGGGIALLLGWQARLVAFLLAGFSLLSGLLFHYIPSLGLEGMEAQTQMIGFMKNVSIAGGMLMIVALGAGAVSLDARRGAVLQPAE